MGPFDMFTITLGGLDLSRRFSKVDLDMMDNLDGFQKLGLDNRDISIEIEILKISTEI
jgi:hypothetical protein